MSLRDRMGAMLATFGAHKVGSPQTTCPGATPVVHIVDDRAQPNTHAAQVKSTVEISNLITTADLPAAFPVISHDRDNFKIEVLDSTIATASIPSTQVELETLRHDRTAFSPRRTMSFELRRIGATHLYRSQYIRLVVDDQDKAANNAQTQYADWDPSKPTEEILAQVVRATYSSPTCGRITWEATVGNARRMHIRVVVHVLRTAPASAGGAGVVTTADAERRVRCWMRRHYAQLSLAPLLLQVHEIDPVENLISISDDQGSNAHGGGSISFVIQSGTGPTAKTQTIGPHVTRPRDTPMVTANHLATLIRADTKFTARTVQNSYFMTRVPGTRRRVRGGAADLIITDPAGGLVRITGFNSSDSVQIATVARVNANAFLGYEPYTHWWGGSIAQRCILQQYDTGDDRIDIVVVGRLDSGVHHGVDFGEALILGSYLGPGQRAIPGIVNSVYIVRECMDGGDRHPDVISHECGHVLLDALHTTDHTEIMYLDNWSFDHPVDASKRFSERRVTFDRPAPPNNRLFQEARIRLLARRMLLPFVVSP